MKMSDISKKSLRKLSIPLLATLLFSCSSVEYAERQQLDSTSTRVQKLQSSLDDQSYRLNSHNVELEILEGKINKIQDNLANIGHAVENLQKDQKKLYQQLVNNNQQNNQTGKFLEKIPADIRILQDNANTTATALEQYRTKINYIEKDLSLQNQRISKVLDSVNILTSIIDNTSSSSGMTYKVRSGDSLDKIAKKYGTSIEALKQANNLNKDLIVVGQTLKIPQ